MLTFKNNDFSYLLYAFNCKMSYLLKFMTEFWNETVCDFRMRT